MRKIKETWLKNNQHQNYDVPSIEANTIFLKFVEPARDLLQSTNQMNSVYEKQMNNLPHIFKCCQQLHPLGENNNQTDFVYDASLVKKIYLRDLALKINPFETKNYFRTNTLYQKHKFVKTPEILDVDRDQLQFDSHFQSGNLLSVEKQLMNQKYHLMMQNDINTYGCTQWFFYRVHNRNISKATFFINNFYKSQSLYKKGMKILIFSMKKYINEQIGWVRGGQQISYFANKITEKKQNSTFVKQFYTLKFTYHFQYEDDEIYFAYNYPYTFSRLVSYLGQKQIGKSKYYNCRTLCKTAADNKIFLVTITDNSVTKSKKNSIFLTSRVHPGQTVSSLMMQGIINYLTSDNDVAAELRTKFIFKIVPMLNPDGVIHGNYRANLAGIDLNRIWDTADRILSPQIYELKKHITQTNKECPVIMFCDLHGHSARKSAFIYGCQNDKLKLLEIEAQSRLFPFMLSFCSQGFQYKSCNFNVQKNKKGTARIQLWKQLKIPNIFTLQASFCSAQNSQYHFRPTDYMDIGVSFCKTIHQYFLNHEKKKQFYDKLKKQKLLNKKNQNDEDDSQSDNDLFDQKTLKELKNGKNIQGLWQKRRITLERPIVICTEQTKQIKLITRRRHTIQRSKRPTKTQVSPETIQTINTIQSQKTMTSSIPTKRLTFDTDIIKVPDPKGYMKRSIFQRVEQNYRGKSTIYRIQRKNLKNINLENCKKTTSIFQIDNTSQDFN